MAKKKSKSRKSGSKKSVSKKSKKSVSNRKKKAKRVFDPLGPGFRVLPK